MPLTSREVEWLYEAAPGAVITFSYPSRLKSGIKMFNYVAYFSSIKRWHTTAAENNISVAQSYKTEDLITLLDNCQEDVRFYITRSWQKVPT